MQYGRYQIIAELGRGSMGVVYKAHDPQIDRLVALKVLREDRVTSEDFVRRFLKEAMAVGRLSHPGIVTVYDVGQDHGSIYIAMEFLQGTPLDELMTARKFTLEEIVSIGIQTAQALHYAHQNGIVHRDIKPPNIIYSPQGAIRVTDFGIARIEDPNGHQMTQAGEILGTPLYMSPEQVMGQALDGRSDMYSLGVILYQLTTNRRPFQGATLAAIFRAITQDSPEPPQILDPAIPAPLSDLIMRLLAKDPSRRFSNGDDLIRALQECLQPPSFHSDNASPQAHRQSRQSPGQKFFLASGLVGLLIVIGLAGFYFLYQQPSAPLSLPGFKQPIPPSPPLSGQSPATKNDTPTVKANMDPLDKKKSREENTAPVQLPSNLSPQDAGKKDLQEKQTLLKMDSRPSGADLFIDGSYKGKTPVNLTVIAGKHEAKLKLDKHLGWEAQLDLSKGGEVPLSIQLLPERLPQP
jgi:eukaryotic-like serine/threonine-protein kinase